MAVELEEAESSARLGAHIGKRVQVLREERKMSISVFARETGMGRRTVYKLEGGGIHNPTVGLLLRIQGVLELPSVELLFGEFPSGAWKSGGLATGGDGDNRSGQDVAV